MSPLDVFFLWHLCFFAKSAMSHLYRLCLYTENIIFSRVFMIKIIFFHFPPKEKSIIFSGKKKYHLYRYYKKDHVQAPIFWKDHLFRTSEENYFQVFFWERSSFLLCLKNKIIFSGKRNIFFPDNTRKIIFQYNFFAKTIFWKHLEKENMVFCAAFIQHNLVLFFSEANKTNFNNHQKL